jgi:hypothetical protein
MMVAAIVSAAALSGARPAHAQGPALAATSSAPRAIVPAPPPVLAGMAEEHFFTIGETAKTPVLPVTTALRPLALPVAPPSVLGEAWAEALRVVLEEMKQSVDAERIEAAEALSAPYGTARTRARQFTLARSPWMPGEALREAIAATPLLTPVTLEPATESGVDTRGEHATLVGVTMELPWRVP